jgi:hypothetical protein
MRWLCPPPKQVPEADFLGLKPKPSVSAVAFVDPSDDRKVVVGGPESKVGAGTHTVMLFDITAGQRPVAQMEFGEGLVTALACAPDGSGVYAGDARGKVAFVDFRTFTINGVFKGSASAIKALVHHRTLPLLASTGLDRFVRFHDTRKKKLLHSTYLKQVGLSMAFDHTAAAATTAPEEVEAPQEEAPPRRKEKKRKEGREEKPKKEKKPKAKRVA